MNLYLNADCMNPETGLPSYPDNYFDLAIVDPPYGIGESQKKNLSRHKLSDCTVYAGGDFDDLPASTEQIKMMRGISKSQIIFGGNYFARDGFAAKDDCRPGN